jgi:hypothetical protein
MIRTLFRCPVLLVPTLWAPTFVDEQIKNLERSGIQARYKLNSLASDGARIAIMESNTHTTQSGIVPLLIAEVAWRANPLSINDVRFCNGIGMVENSSFSTLAARLELHKGQRLTIHPSEEFVPFMAACCNLVISHQLNCDNTRLYFETAYLGYPLLHNSAANHLIGYYYQDSDINTAAALLSTLIASHDNSLLGYENRTNLALKMVSPTDFHNRNSYERRLVSLFSGKGVATV